MTEIRMGTARAWRRYCGRFGLGVTMSYALGLASVLLVSSLIAAPSAWRPLGVPEPDRLVMISRGLIANGANPLLSRTELGVLSAIPDVFGGFSSVRELRAAVRFPDRTVRRVGIQVVSDNFFQVLGVEATAVSARGWGGAVVSSRLGHLIGSEALGSTIEIGGRPIQVVGIAVGQFAGTQFEPTDIWVPVGSERDLFVEAGAAVARAGAEERACCTAVARLRQGVSPRDASLVLASALPAASNGNRVLAYQGVGVDLTRLGTVGLLISIARAVAWALFGVSLLNVGMMVQIRAWGDGPDIALQKALGATTLDIVGQWCVEATLLVVTGTLAAMAIAAGTIAIARTAPHGPLGELLLGTPLTGSHHGTALAAAVSCGLAIIVGVGAAAARARPCMRRATSASSNRRPGLLRTVLASQSVLASAMVASALMCAWWALEIDSAVSSAGSAKLTIGDLDVSGSSVGEQRLRLLSIRRRLDASPLLRYSVALSSAPPFSTVVTQRRLSRFGADPSVSGLNVGWTLVDHELLRLLDVNITSGRSIEASDVVASQSVVIVNETLARRWWPGGQAVGQVVKVAGEKRPRLIVGVAADIIDGDPGSALRGGHPQVYVPIGQLDGQSVRTISVVTSVTTETHRAALDAVLAEGEPPNALDDVRSLDAQLDRHLGPVRQILRACTVGAILSLVIAVVGLCSNVAYASSLRRKDAAIRLAMGATVARVARDLVLEETAGLAIGLVVGGYLAFQATSAITQTLIGARNSAAVVFAVVAVSIVAVTSTAAAWIPATAAFKRNLQVLLNTD